MPLFSTQPLVPCSASVVAIKVTSLTAAIVSIALVAVVPVLAQTGEPLPGYTPITTPERLEWIVDGNIGPRSLGVGVLKASWDTAWNTPSEWNPTWAGFGKRFVNREVQVGISNSLEAGLGAIWGEDVRYFRSRRTSLWSRTGHAAKTVFLAPRRDGRLAPAWAYYIGTTGNNLIANTWLPPSATTAGATSWRIGSGLLGRFAGNLWFEFWPDVRERVFPND